ncbi:MAG: hypothetical protein OFPII_28750 [Osedax symbiont Rs1]|nr:MAG: hypothetical protein OFPII_28750 [Osedax symbiont Rs1]
MESIRSEYGSNLFLNSNINFYLAIYVLDWAQTKPLGLVLVLASS